MNKVKPKTLERKLSKPFDVQFSKPEIVEKENGLKWYEFPVTLKARDSGPIFHWAWGKIIHDLSKMKKPSTGKIPIDHVHSDEALGVIDEFDTSDGLLLKGKLVSTGEGDLAWNIATKIAAGVPYQSSIFFDDLEDGTPFEVEEVKEGKSKTVNGQVFEGPGCIVRKWMLRGVAVCLYGADPNTNTQVLKHQPHEEPMDPKEILKQFTEKFGAELANKYFTEGLSFEEAVAKFCDVLQERLKASEKLASDKDEKIAALEAEITAFKDEKAKNADDEDDADDEDEDKKDKKGKKASASKDQKIAELKAKLSVWERQYGGMSYDALGKQDPDSTGGGANPEQEYAAELIKANVEPGGDE